MPEKNSNKAAYTCTVGYLKLVGKLIQVHFRVLRPVNRLLRICEFQLLPTCMYECFITSSASTNFTRLQFECCIVHKLLSRSLSRDDLGMSSHVLPISCCSTVPQSIPSLPLHMQNGIYGKYLEKFSLLTNLTLFLNTDFTTPHVK